MEAVLDQLNVPVPDETRETYPVKREALQKDHEERRKDLLAELLQKMGARLRYGFDFTYLKGRAYYPQGHETEAEELSSLGKGLIEIFWKGRPLIVRAIEPPREPSPEKKDSAT